MTSFSLLFVGCLAAGPNVEVVGLDGETHGGSLVAVSPEAVQIESEIDGAQSINIDELRLLSFPDVPAPDEFADPPTLEVWLTDGSHLAVSQFQIKLNETIVEVEEMGEVTLPRGVLRAVRLAEAEGVASRWEELRGRENAADMLVVEREASLDFVEGAVGDVTVDEITFLLKEQTRTLPRERAYGIVFAPPEGANTRATMQAAIGRSELSLTELTVTEGGVNARLASGPSVKLPLERLRGVEFSGRVRLLTDLKPVVLLPEGVAPEEQYRYFRRGSEPFGAPLRIGADEIITDEGLWLHSGVTVRYRINRDYRRFVAMAGMDHNVGGNRSVRLAITGDGSELFNDVIKYQDEARQLDLDVSGVRDLEIRVERLPEAIETNIFGIQEHLDLGKTRLIR